MATVTLERLAAGIRAAHAKGDVEAVRKLGTAYRQMQGRPDVQAVPPADLKPGSKAYALWARDQAVAGNKLPQVSDTPPAPEFSGPNQDIGSKLFAASGSFLEGVPVAGPTLIDWAKKGRGALHGMSPEEVDTEFAEAKEANPISSGAGGLAGGVLPLLPLGFTQLGGRLLGTVGTTGQRIAAGSASGAALSGVDALARGDDLATAGLKAGLGGGLGALFPVAGALKNTLGNKAAQRAATSAAIKDAPDASDLKSVASGMFQQLDQSGVQVSGQRFGDMAVDLVKKFTKLRANETLDPKAIGALKELVKAASDVQAGGGGIALSDLHTLRQIAQKSAQSAEGRDKMFSTQIINAIDDMISGLKPSDMIGGADPKQAASLMFDAISTWGRSRRVGLVEEAIYRAQNTASGLENGLRVEFRKLLQDADARKLFTAAERQAIEDVVRGNVMSNTLKLLGRFGFGTGGAGNMLGGTIGFGAGSVLGGPIGGILAAAAGTGARKASEKLAEGSAKRVAKVVGTAGVPVIAPKALPHGLLPGALLPLELTKRREPINITVRGGS